MNETDKAELQRKFGHVMMWGVVYRDSAARNAPRSYSGGLGYHQAVQLAREKAEASAEGVKIVFDFGPPPKLAIQYLAFYFDAAGPNGEPDYEQPVGVFDSRPDLAQALGITPPEPEAADKVAIIAEGYERGVKPACAAVYRWYPKRGWVKLDKPVPF